MKVKFFDDNDNELCERKLIKTELKKLKRSVYLIQVPTNDMIHEKMTSYFTQFQSAINHYHIDAIIAPIKDRDSAYIINELKKGK